MKTERPYTVRARSGRPGEWQVWIRPITGVAPAVCAAWTRRSLRMAPYEFLCSQTWPRSKTGAERVVASLIDYLKANGSGALPSSAPLLGDYAKLFIDAATSPRAQMLNSEGKPYSPSSLELYQTVFKNHVAPDAELCALRMDCISRSDIQAYMSRLLVKLGGPCRTHQLVWVFLRLVARQYSLDTDAQDPFRGLKKPTYQAALRGALTEAELVHVFSKPSHFASAMERAVCALVFWGGLRAQEAFALKPEHLDRAMKVIRIEHAIKGLGRHFAEDGTTKGRKARLAPLSSQILKAVDALAKETGPQPYILMRKDGSRPSTGWWNNSFHAVMQRSGIDTAARHITPHSARHSFGSVLMARGTPKGIIQRILGHFDERTTEGYLHVALEEIEKAAAKIGDTGKQSRAAKGRAKARKSEA